jgi:uncharacterized integral membrane protein
MSTSSQHERRDELAAEVRRRTPAQWFRTGGVLALTILGTLFAVLNVREVKVNWIIGSGHAPLIVVIVVSLLGGIVLTYLVERLSRRRR